MGSPVKSRRSFLSHLAAGSAAVAAGRWRALAQNRPLRVGLIGPGDRGKALMREVRGAQGAQLVAVADIYLRRLREAREIQSDIRTYFDYRDMLAQETLDAVVVATPPHRHAEPFVAALEAGAHVYVEKTMAFSVEHAKQMRAARQLFPRQVVQVGIQSTSSGAARDVPMMLADDKLGHISELRANHYRNHTDQAPPWVREIPADATPENIRWQEFLGDAPRIEFDAFRFINWRLFWDYSGGNVFENFVHQLGFWFQALDLGIPDQVTTTGGIYFLHDGREVPDVWSLAMQFEEANLMLNWTSSFSNRFFGVREYALGSKGTIEKVDVSTRYIPEEVTNPLGQEIVGQSPGESHMQNFIDAIRLGREPNCPFEIGFRTAIACRMAVNSLLEGRTVRWDAANEQIV
jgi:predicted dehydrogenase